MLEVNDFNAVRISLASPEQIKSWSYGEVLKPETINYRTLKPEKDGLFCEKIFGPTKDFECYCGKYKRVRYKGIICDKCGVEVTRSKVRRERMGHIELASPVSHIWFVKGAPSRIGLLLDISARSLERVLYFAQYIVTTVDEDARRLAKESIQADREKEELKERAKADELKAGFKAEFDAYAADREESRTEKRATLEKDLAERMTTLVGRGTKMESDLAAQLGEAAKDDITFEGELLAQADQAVNEFVIERFRDELNRGKEALDTEFSGKFQDLDAMIDADVELQQSQYEGKATKVNEDFEVKRKKLQDETGARSDELDELKPLLLLSETRFRELRERHGHVFRAGMGAEAIREIVSTLTLDDLREKLRSEIHSSSGQRRKKATKRLRVVESFRKSGNKPEWMIFTMLPVLPPDLRPMVQLDGGRFATSDLNDLYRRVINRNNRLKRLLELGAPEIIIRNEKRMLQEAVDSLIDNGRRGRAVSGSSNHKLKSLSDMLKGKQGRFRQNLLGKRVDYSGRSVIVVGPTLKLHQCGLPKKMALELFKPFVMRRLVERNFAPNIKSAKRVVERMKPEVWDVLEEVISDRPVLLNRAPTLHRLGIQAFEPVLIDGSAIQIHPLVCSAFNADFDGDQMAVHVPLSSAAVEEARTLMLSTENLLLPSSGEPVVAPTLDMVLGCYYMTLLKPGTQGEGMVFSDQDEAKLAYDLGVIGVQAQIRVKGIEGLEETSVGRIIFDEILPPALQGKNKVMDKKALKELVNECYRLFGNQITAEVVDSIKRLGFDFATRSGISISVSDIESPAHKQEILAWADEQVTDIRRQFDRGMMTEDERHDATVKVWEEATERLIKDIQNTLDPFGSIYMMSNSGAKGNITQIRQMAGMRGLMSDPSGRIIELPIRSSFREGLDVLEYFISTHGARKGLADTALRTADSGYLTRRLIDVAQDVIIRDDDCGTTNGLWIADRDENHMASPFVQRISGRLAASPVVHPESGEILANRNELISPELAQMIKMSGIKMVNVRTPLGCESRRGVCQACYGESLARGRLVDNGEAVGIIAAQSIGEPGTQLTMRTFHTGGVAGMDITSGLPRVEELFEARTPKGVAIIAEFDGTAEVIREEEGGQRVRILSSEVYRDEYTIPEGFQLLVHNGDIIDADTPLARGAEQDPGPDGKAVAIPEIKARIAGQVEIHGNRLNIIYEDRAEKTYIVPAAATIKVQTGEFVRAGDQLTEGPINPQDVLNILGRDAVQDYLVAEVQKVYRTQGVTINDKHVEVITRQMLRKVRVEVPGDTELLPGELVDRFTFEDVNARILAEGGDPASAVPVLLGVTKASLNTESFLAAASFQETTRVLTEAAITGATDRLVGLKENVIIGKLIPAGSGLHPQSKPRSLELSEEFLDSYLS